MPRSVEPLAQVESRQKKAVAPLEFVVGLKTTNTVEELCRKAQLEAASEESRESPPSNVSVARELLPPVAASVGFAGPVLWSNVPPSVP
jgi:hypothetical protein